MVLPIGSRRLGLVFASGGWCSLIGFSKVLRLVRLPMASRSSWREATLSKAATPTKKATPPTATATEKGNLSRGSYKSPEDGTRQCFSQLDWEASCWLKRSGASYLWWSKLRRCPKVSSGAVVGEVFFHDLWIYMLFNGQSKERGGCIERSVQGHWRQHLRCPLWTGTPGVGDGFLTQSKHVPKSRIFP